jgi:toxin FitB
VYLVDTDVISEARKGAAANPGVRAFLAGASRDGVGLYLSVVTVGELRQGVERIRHRGDAAQARRSRRSGVGCGFRTRRIRSTSRSPPRR